MEKQLPAEIEWIIKNKERLNIYGLEKDCGMKQNTVYGFIKGKRTLAEKWEKPLIKWVRDFTKILKN